MHVNFFLLFLISTMYSFPGFGLHSHHHRGGVTQSSIRSNNHHQGSNSHHQGSNGHHHQSTTHHQSSTHHHDYTAHHDPTSGRTFYVHKGSFVCLVDCLFVVCCLLFDCVLVCLVGWLFVSLFICLFVCLVVCLLFVCLFICLFVCWFVWLFGCLFCRFCIPLGIFY